MSIFNVANIGLNLVMLFSATVTIAGAPFGKWKSRPVSSAGQLKDPKSESSMMHDYSDLGAPFSIQLPYRLKR
jgi:hypothetical protein